MLKIKQITNQTGKHDFLVILSEDVYSTDSNHCRK